MINYPLALSTIFLFFITMQYNLSTFTFCIRMNRCMEFATSYIWRQCRVKLTGFESSIESCYVSQWIALSVRVKIAIKPHVGLAFFKYDYRFSYDWKTLTIVMKLMSLSTDRKKFPFEYNYKSLRRFNKL